MNHASIKAMHAEYMAPIDESDGALRVARRRAAQRLREPALARLRPLPRLVLLLARARVLDLALRVAPVRLLDARERVGEAFVRVPELAGVRRPPRRLLEVEPIFVS